MVSLYKLPPRHLHEICATVHIPGKDLVSPLWLHPCHLHEV
jgi:hypothetical protein